MSSIQKTLGVDRKWLRIRILSPLVRSHIWHATGCPPRTMYFNNGSSYIWMCKSKDILLVAIQEQCTITTVLRAYECESQQLFYEFQMHVRFIYFIYSCWTPQKKHTLNAATWDIEHFFLLWDVERKQCPITRHQCVSPTLGLSKIILIVPDIARNVVGVQNAGYQCFPCKKRRKKDMDNVNAFKYIGYRWTGASLHFE